jgi:tetratricopeptide (TPR) repeat protein
MRRTSLIAAFLFAASALAQNDVGEVAFANSGAAEAQPAFLRGLALLHNFEYPDAAEAFREAEKIDPSFAMAYWGEAMTHTHPLWFQQNAEAARAALLRLGSTRSERLAKAKTDRERDYLRAVEVLYGEGTKEERDDKYAEAMGALHARWPDDVDGTAFYALALLGTAHEGRDFGTYMRAAALLEEVYPSHMRHPGVLHFLIHSYDDPVHAPLGMRAARRYGAIAPNAGHALHMTSHIFIALGLWDDVIDANRRAIAVVNKQRAARSKPAADCGHYPTWLHYAYLQEARFDEASKALEACRASAFTEPFVSAGQMDSYEGRIGEYADMRAHQVASGGPMPPPPPPLPAGDGLANARFTLAYADVLAARGDLAALRAAVARLHALPPSTSSHHTPTSHLRTEVMLQQADALLLSATGKRSEAIALLEKAAQSEAAMPFEFGPPVIAKPTRELLADEYLAASRPVDAERAYRTALERTPGRAATVQGLQRAAARR